jgi:hypothetical protein
MGQSTLISNEKAHKAGSGKVESTGPLKRSGNGGSSKNVDASKSGENQGPTHASGKARETGDGTIEENVEEQAP